ncbi:MAG: hypothetical protein ABIF01_00240 [Candidatus Micrarchaeota archaeon]
MAKHFSVLVGMLLFGLVLFGCQQAIDAGEKDYSVKDDEGKTVKTGGEGEEKTPGPEAPEAPKITGTCGDGKVEADEHCDIGGLKTAIFRDTCLEGKSCIDCKCVSRVVTARCGDGYVSDSKHGGDEECDLGGGRYAPDDNADGIPDSYSDPCPQPKECIGCKCKIPTPEVLEDCNGDDTPPELVGGYSFIKGIQGEFSQRKWREWGDNWCAPTSASYSFRYWFGRGFTNFLDQYSENETKKKRADTDGDGKVTELEATEEMADELGKLMRTDPDSGTMLDKFVAGLEKFINQSGYSGKFIIKKYGKALGQDRDPTYEDYRRELEACEDVLVGIKYPRGGGHAMVGKSSSATPNADGTYNISLMDPWTGKEYHTKMWPNATLEYGRQNVTMYRVIAVSPVTPAITTCGDMSLQRPNSQGVFEECEKGVDICPQGSGCDYDTCRCVSTMVRTYCGDEGIQRPNSDGVYEECEIGIECKQAGLRCDYETCACMPYCGDGVCVTGETYQTCPEDCPPVCGDGVCQPEENYTSCSLDCFKPAVCWDGVVDGTEQCEQGIPCSEPMACNMETCKCETPDRDHDGYPDYADNCPDTPNTQGDIDGDGIGDPCDPVPVNCAQYCASESYSLVAAEDVAPEVCNTYKGADSIQCQTVCSYIHYYGWDWGVSDYSCCCKQVNTYPCTDCPGENPECPDCPESWPPS